MSSLLPIVKHQIAGIRQPVTFAGDSVAKAGHFGQTVSRLRGDKGWTRTELSRRSGIPTRTLHAYESGSSQNPSWDHVCKLSRAFGVSCEEFREPNGNGDT